MSMGSFARDDDYGFSDLGIPIGAPRTGPPRLPPQYPTELGPMAQDLPPEARWQLGAIAAQNGYRAVGGDPWNNALPERPKPPPAPGERSLMPFANWRAEPPKRTTGVVASEYMLPQSPTDVGLMAVGGPFGKAIATTGMLLDSSPAEAGKVKLPAGRGPLPEKPNIFRQGASVTRAPPPWQEMSVEEFTKSAPQPPVPHQDITRVNTYENPKLRAKAEALWETYPQYAEQYPEVGPPALMEKRPDPNKPGKYLSMKPLGEVPYSSFEEAAKLDATPRYFFEKKLLPQVEQFQKDRNTVQREMDLHGYTPYFDPAKRADVDPANYGPFPDTRVEAYPKKAQTQAKFDEMYGTPEARERLQAGYARGKTIEGSDNWYFMKQLEDEYVKELGPQAGRDAFRKEFSGMMAATTGGASPYDNFLMSHYANYLSKKGERVDQRAYEMSFPVGGRFASGNMDQAQKYIDRGMTPFDAAKNPKRSDFDNAYLGNRMSGTMDEQMFGAILPGETIPEWYGPATRVLHEEAAKAGTDPRGFQDVAWAGLKSIKEEAAHAEKVAKAEKKKPGMGHNIAPFESDYGGPMINTINRSIETTHRLTGMPREEIVRRGLVLKEIPMYGLGAIGAGSVMGNVARSDDYQPRE